MPPLSDDHNDSPETEQWGKTQVPVNAVGFGNAFTPSENLLQKSMLHRSIVQAVLPIMHLSTRAVLLI